MAKGLRNHWRTAPEPTGRSGILTLLGHPDGEPAPEARADLLATIHAQIIPQLVLAHTAEHFPLEGVCADARLPPTDAEVAECAQLAIREDVPAALAFVQAIAAEGISLEVILLQLIAPAARFLGEQWEDDRISFTEVTIGLATLQQIVHILGPSFAPGLVDRGFVVLVSPQPEQHTLGLYLLGEFLRRAGWGVQVAPSMSESDLVDLVASEHVDMVGISVSNSDLVKPLTRLVTAIRKASINPTVGVMLGGSPELSDTATQVGATFCSDPRDAVRWLEQHARIKEKHDG
jgi:methanogenic corrinoid protein MtbC1